MLFFAGLEAANATRNKRTLIEDLLDANKYNRRVRPVLRSEDAVIVTFGLVVREIEDLVSSGCLCCSLIPSSSDCV